MRPFLLSIATLGIILLSSGVAHAQGVYRYFNSGHPYIHDRYHQVAVQQALAWQQSHYNAHLYPMTWWQYQQTMDWVRRDAMDGWLAARYLDPQFDYLTMYRTGNLLPLYYYRPVPAVITVAVPAVPPAAPAESATPASGIVPASYNVTPEGGITITTQYYKGK